jgi:hypothetical protein
MKKAPDASPRLDAAPRLDGTPRKAPPALSNGEGPEMRRRARRALVEDPSANDWRQPSLSGEAIYPARELTAPIIPQRDPETVPRRMGFFERLGFGRRRQA